VAHSRHFARVFGVLAVALALATAFAPVPPEWVERVYSRSIYLSFQPYLTAASNRIPIALLDVGVALILGWLVATFVRDWRTRGAGRTAARSAVRLLVTVSVVYVLFVASWGLNYRRVPLEAKVAFDRSRVTQVAAVKLAATAVERLNVGHQAAHASTFRPDVLEDAFVQAQAVVGPRVTSTNGRPKRSLAGLYFRYSAVDGMTVPVFLEIILNPDLLPVERPSVLAHEWAHLAGYADESEATFVGWIAGVRSDDPVARYSAWLDAYGLAVNALPRAARGSIPPLDDGPGNDLRAIAERYARSSATVRRAARGVYDSYLKANRIDEGIQNYEQALQLILGTEVGAALSKNVTAGPAEAGTPVR
jgi:hypothetical protein